MVSADCTLRVVQEQLVKLEAELRGAKRREEKLAALHFRLREDVKAAAGDPTCDTPAPP